MTVRSINFTGRKKILLDDIQLVMEDSKAGPRSLQPIINKNLTNNLLIKNL